MEGRLLPRSFLVSLVGIRVEMLDVDSLVPKEMFVDCLQELIAALFEDARFEVQDSLVLGAFPSSHILV